MGPAGSGKTERVLELYRKVKSQDQLAQVIFLAPTARAVREVKERLFACSPIKVLANPLVLTFPELACLIIRAAGGYAAEAPTTMLYLILRKIVQDAGQNGELEQLGTAYQFPGFTRALAELINELKLAAVIPEAFRELVLARRPKPMDHLIADLYQAYQDKLTGQNLFDRAGLYWQARDTIITHGLGELARAKLFIADGFSNFTPIEMSLLELIAERLPRTVVTLPYEKDTSRAELFEATEKTLKELQQHLRPSLEILSAPTEATALRLLERNLFSPETGVPKACLSPKGAQAEASIHLLEAPGMKPEVEQVARTVKELIIKEGYSSEDIAILVRDPAEYREATRKVFTEMGIPYCTDSGVPLRTSPIVTTFLTLLALRVDDFPREATSALAGNSLFTVTDEHGKEVPAPSELEALAVEAGITQGQRQWLDRLEALAAVIDHRIANQTNGAEKGKLLNKKAKLKKAQHWTGELFKALDVLPHEAPPAHIAAVLERLFDSLHLLDHIMEESDPVRLAEQLQASKKLRQVISLTAPALELSGVQSYTLLEFLDQVREAVSQVEIGLSPDPGGRVRVFAAHRARSLSFPVVFILGLAEGTFPAPLPTCPFYEQEERRRLARAGIPLQPRKLLGAQERLLFYQAITRARERLYLSRPTADADGRPRLPSCYLQEATRVLDQLGITPSVSRVTLSQLLPARASSVSELRRIVLAEAPVGMRHKQRDLTAARDWLRQESPELVASIARGIEQERRRWRGEPSEFAGLINDTEASKKLAERFSPDYLFSVGELNDYASCPFLYFCQHLLKLAPPPELEEELSPLDLGLLYHRILFHFYRELRQPEKGYAILLPEHADEMKASIQEFAEQAFNQGTGFKPALKPPLVAIQKDRLLNLLARFVDAELASPFKQAYRPAHFEAAFGVVREPEACDEVSTRSPLEIGGGKERLLVAGKIDRIDILTDSPDGKPAGFAVVDYKTGAGVPAAGDVREAADVQLQLYALAAQRTLLADKGLKPTEGYFYSLKDLKPKTRLSKLARDSNESLEQLLGRASEQVKGYASDIRRGRFAPAACSICRYCDFRFICRQLSTRESNGGK